MNTEKRIPSLTFGKETFSKIEKPFTPKGLLVSITENLKKQEEKINELENKQVQLKKNILMLESILLKGDEI